MYKAILWKQRRRKELRDKRNNVIFVVFVIAIILITILCCFHGFILEVNASEIKPKNMMDGDFYLVECTAYYNPEGRLTASQKPTVEGLTIAGASEWLGCTCILYDEDMNFIGFYEFTDTGYGKDGDIQRGETVDLYFDSYDDAKEWGRRKVYIQIIPSVG